MRFPPNDFKPLYNEMQQFNKEISIEEEDFSNLESLEASLKDRKISNVSSVILNPNAPLIKCSTGEMSPPNSHHHMQQAPNTLAIGHSQNMLTPNYHRLPSITTPVFLTPNTPLTPTPSTPAAANWPLIQSKIDDLNEYIYLLSLFEFFTSFLKSLKKS